MAVPHGTHLEQLETSLLGLKRQLEAYHSNESDPTMRGRLSRHLETVDNAYAMLRGLRTLLQAGG